MENSSKDKKYYPNIYESVVAILIFIFLSFFIGALISMGAIQGSNFLQDTSTLLGYILAAGGTLILITRFKKIKNPESNLFRYSKFSIRTAAIIILLTLAVIIAVEPITNLIPIPEMFREMLNQMYSRSLPAFITAVIAAPILEELIFRGIILDGLLKNYNPLKAIIVTNILFGVAHLNPWQFVGAFILGIFISWIYWKTKNIVLPIIIHFINNLTSYLVIFITSESPANVTLRSILDNDFLYIVLIIISLAIISLAIIFQRKIIPSQE